MAIPEKLSITEGQYAALQAACDALIPALEAPAGQDEAFWAATATENKVPDSILEAMVAQNPADQKEFVQLLGLLESGFMMGLVGGGFKKFRSQPKEKQEAILIKWSESRIGKLRKAFGTLKKLVCFIHYGSSPLDGKGQAGNPAWKGMDYPGPLDVTPGKRPNITPVWAKDGESIHCQTLIIGSGAGGGLAAGMLAEAGEDVVLLDKGPFMAGADFTMQEAEMIGKTYDRKGALSTQDGGATVFAGSCLGGGTTINWTGAFPTPAHVLEEWDRQYGLEFVRSKTYKDGVNTVMKAFSVNSDHSPHNFQNEALVRGSERIGQQANVIQRNVSGCDADNCESCGYCGLGCRRGTKQGTLRTWIERAADKGSRIMVQSEALRLKVLGGKVEWVEVQQIQLDGSAVAFRIHPQKVIVAAGSVQTPALLLRSGLSHPMLGQRLYFHPTLAVSADYDEPSRPWLGTMMSAVNKSGLFKDGNFGYWIETPPIHAGLAALGLPWKSGHQHKTDMARMANMANFIVLVRDKFGGKVTVDKKGNAVVHYQLHPYDRNHMIQGIRDAFKIHRAAGAKEILVPTNKGARYNVEKSKLSMDGFLDRLPTMGWKTNQFNLYTAHQMGTCSMGKDAGQHPLDLNGRFRGVDNLYVADGSAMPSSAGINPMISIMALTHHTIQQMIG